MTKDASIAPSFLFLEEEKEKLEGQENSVVKPGKEQEKEEKSIHEPGKEQEKENSLMENKTAGHKKTSKSNKKEN